MDLSIIASLIRAADAARIDSIVRVPDHSSSFIHRVLDAGATGVLVPHVRSRDDAEAIVAATKYAPVGVRGACPGTRGAGRGIEAWTATYEKANAETIVWALIEDVEGVDAIEQIVSVPGLDALLFGPIDLAQTLGLGGDLTDPKIQAMAAQVTKAADAAGVQLIAGPILTKHGGGEAARLRDARIVLGEIDITLLVNGFQESIVSLKEQLPAVAGGAA